MRSTLREGRSCCARFWREGHLQALDDIHARWRTGGFWLLAVVWSSGLCLSLIILSLLTAYQFLRGNNPAACQPDGNFYIYPEHYQYWSRSGFFQITLGYGNLSFTQVKVIDIVWDIVCGRGGQALIALVSWHVFANYVTTSMEVAPVTFNTYRTVFLSNESSIVSILRLIRDFACRRGLHSRTAMMFMIATMIFSLVFPSFASAMTGYNGRLKSYVPDASNNFISFDGFRGVLYVIHDGWRVNRTVDYPITFGSTYDEPVLDTTYSEGRWDNTCISDAHSSEVQEPCRIQPDVTNYVRRHGIFGLENETSTFLDVTLGPPVLNISAFYLASSYLGANWTDPRTQFQPFTNKSLKAWSYGNDTYDLDYISSRGTCQAVENYKWGFSFIQLNIMIMLCMLWTIGTFTMWIQSHLTMKNRGRTDVAGEYKAVLELADALNTQLLQARDIDTMDILALPESNLRHRITKDLRGGLIIHEMPRLTTGNTGERDARNGFRSLLKKEACWIILILMSLVPGFFIFILNHYMQSWVFFAFSATLVLTVCIGSSGKSRAVLFLWLFTLLCFLPLLVLLYLPSPQFWEGWI